ncbi:MAG: hypothetical protein AB7U82_13455 [Blastocatellales bacterium]
MPVEQLIYTDRPRGKGFDPACAGYQIKACSAGLSAEARGQLNSICMHYGDAVYTHAPRAAKDRETEWRTRAESLDSMPREVLGEFPTIWSYDRLADGNYALTQVSYVGITHDGRFGNFLAHALVFPPETLAGHNFNPLSLARAKVFKTSDTSDETSLPALGDLGRGDEKTEACRILRRQPFNERLAPMVATLTNATPASRPVVVCINDWKLAQQLVEGLLNLLPPSARRLTTFCTYESDRKYLVPTATGARPADVVASHHLIVLCGDEGKRFDLRPDEYRATFTIFNFAENQFSDAGEISRYAQFAADCASDDKKLDQLKYLHELIEELGHGRNEQAWSALAPVAELNNEKLELNALTEAARALADAAQEPRQVEVAWRRLRPHVQLLAQVNEWAVLTTLTSSLAALSDRSDVFLNELFTLAQQAFTAGRGRLADALLKAGGKSRDSLLLALLGEVMKQPHRPFQNSLTAEDRERMRDLLVDGLRLADQAPAETAPPIEPLLLFVFRQAKELGCAAEAWNVLGGPMVKAKLGGEMNAERQKLAQELAACLTADQSPDANAWLNLQLLKAAKPAGQALVNKLVEIARAGAQCADAAGLTGEVIEIAKSGMEQPRQLALAFAHLEISTRGTPSEEKFAAAYSEQRALIEEEQEVNKLRGQLADARATPVLLRELTSDVVPWNEESPNKFKSWLNGINNSKERSHVIDGARSCVAQWMRQPNQASQYLPLAEALWPKQQEKTGGDNGLAELAGAIIGALPLEPLDDQWAVKLKQLPDKTSPQAKTRLRLLSFLRRVDTEADKRDWSLTKFPYKDQEWRAVAALPPNERDHIAQWCLNTFRQCGVSKPEEADALIHFFLNLGYKSIDGLAEVVADTVEQLLEGRDPVTCVQAAMAFAHNGLDGASQLTEWGMILKAILDRFDKNTYKLFDAHLEHRFGWRDQKPEKSVLELRKAAGLPAPKSSTPPAPAKDQDKSAAPESSAKARVGNVFKRIFRSGSGDPPKSGERG